MKKKLDLKEITTRKQTQRVAERLQGVLTGEEQPVWSEDFTASGEEPSPPGGPPQPPKLDADDKT